MALNLLRSDTQLSNTRSPRRRRQRSDGSDGGLRPRWRFKAHFVVELWEDQLRMGLTDGSLTIRRDEIVDLPDLVSDIQELAGHTHPRPFVLSVILVGGSLVLKLPEVSPSAQEDGGADQFRSPKSSQSCKYNTCRR